MSCEVNFRFLGTKGNILIFKDKLFEYNKKGATISNFYSSDLCLNNILLGFSTVSDDPCFKNADQKCIKLKYVDVDHVYNKERSRYLVMTIESDNSVSDLHNIFNTILHTIDMYKKIKMSWMVSKTNNPLEYKYFDPYRINVFCPTEKNPKYAFMLNIHVYCESYLQHNSDYDLVERCNNFSYARSGRPIWENEPRKNTDQSDRISDCSYSLSHESESESQCAEFLDAIFGTGSLKSMEEKIEAAINYLFKDDESYFEIVKYTSFE